MMMFSADGVAQGQANFQHRVQRFVPRRSHKQFRLLMLYHEDEQLKMNDCYYDHKDWRVCKKEVSGSCIPNLPNILRSTNQAFLYADGGVPRVLEKTWQ